MGALSYKRFLSLFVLRSEWWWWWWLAWRLKAINRKTECCPCCRGDVERNSHAQGHCVRSKFGDQPASVFSGYRQTPERISYYRTILFHHIQFIKYPHDEDVLPAELHISSPKCLHSTFFRVSVAGCMDVLLGVKKAPSVSQDWGAYVFTFIFPDFLSQNGEKGLLASSCQSVRVRVRLTACISTAPAGQIYLKFWTFTKNLSRKIQNLVSTKQKYRQLHTKT